MQILLLTGCATRETNQLTDEINSEKKEEELEVIEEEPELMELAVIKEINTKDKTLVVKSTISESEIILSYTGGADIRDKYDMVISMTQLEIGEIADVFYDLEDKRLISMKLSDKAWEYTNVANLIVDRSNKTMIIAEDKYQYNDNLLLISQGKFIDLLELNEKDVLTVRGCGGKIHSITIEKGHGYIKLENDEAFLGGWVEVGQEIVSVITEDMLIVAPEGDYKLTVLKDGVGGSKSITVKRDEEITVDIGNFKGAPIKSGSIDFQITPEDANVYIDGTKIDSSELVVLNYGTYSLKVEAAGYNTYYAKIVLNSSLAVVKVNLESSETAEDTPEITTKPTSFSSTKNVVEGYKVYVNLPVGVKVYFDGVYMGIAPVEFSKASGTHTIILSKEGYTTKSYTVYINDKEEDATFSFSDLGTE